MNRFIFLAFCVSTLLLTACGDQLSPASPPTTPPPIASPAPTPIAPVPGGQINVDNEFWYGTMSGNGRSIPAGMGFMQTGTSVRGVLVFTGSDGDVVSSPVLSGTLQGSNMAIGFVDSVGDVITVAGTFTSEVSFTGTMTLTVSGEKGVVNLAFNYDSPLSTQMRVQRVSSLKEFAEKLK